MEKEPTATGARRRLLPLPVGKSIWEEVAEHCYCVDKTLLIRALLATRTGTVLFTRPRRFGKTTAMQMLKCFFEKRGADKLPEIRSWYDGYVFGGREVYNPWSVLYYFNAGCYKLRRASRSSEAENELENTFLTRDIDAFRTYIEEFLLESASYLCRSPALQRNEPNESEIPYVRLEISNRKVSRGQVCHDSGSQHGRSDYFLRGMSHM